jgi:hypothetical protein
MCTWSVMRMLDSMSEGRGFLILLNWLIKVNEMVNNAEFALFFGDSY